MANISISDLHPAGSALFSDSESFVGFMKDVSEAELKITGGGKGSKFRVVLGFPSFGFGGGISISNNNNNNNNNGSYNHG